jgi:hypothetical protein
VPVLAVTALLTHEHPSLGFELSDDLAALHEEQA